MIEPCPVCRVKDDEWDTGFQAYLAGSQLCDNPYTVDSYPWGRWKEGWEAGRNTGANG